MEMDHVLQLFDSDHSTSEENAFDLPQYGLFGLRIYHGFRCQDSIESMDVEMHRQEWATMSNAEHARSQTRRGFLDKDHPGAIQVGQAINLSRSMMETPRSVKIMAGVAKRLVDANPRGILHIIGQTLDCKAAKRGIFQNPVS